MQKKTVTFLGFLFIVLFSLSTQRVSAQQIAYKGIYIDSFDGILGNTSKEDSLLHYLKDSSFNSIICYRMSSVVSATLNSTKNNTLAAFLKKARSQYGIKNILASSESYDTFKSLIAPYNRSRADSLERFNYYYLEFEFWNSHSTSPVSSSNNGYYCTTYLQPKGYSCDTSGAFLYYRKMLKSLDSLALKDGIRSATYIGNPNQGQCKFIASTVDLLLCDNYTSTISNIFTNVKTRFTYLGSTTKTLQIVPIFASYSPGGTFLGDWLCKAPIGPHSEKGIYTNYFLPRYNAETGSWKSKLNLLGYQWYRYSGMPHNGNYSSGNFCTAPTTSTVSSVTASSASINWQAMSGGLSYLLYYRTSGSTTWQGPLASSSNAVTLSNLLASTTYDYQIKSVCVSSTSSTSTIFNFTTLSNNNCGIPSNLTASSITDNSAILSWNSVSTASSYTLRYRKVGSTNWTTQSVSANSYTVLALTASSIYEFQTMANCSSGSGNYSSSVMFSTLAPPCNIPSNISSSSITENSATIKWTAVSGASSYTLQYRIIGAGSWNTTTSTTTSKQLVALVSGSTYEVQVQTNCSATNTSNFSASTPFTTLVNLCGTPINVIASAATTSSFTINWTAVSSSNGYKVQYRKQSSSAWTTLSTNFNFKNIGSLTASTTYEFAVATQCASGLSAYSTIQSITTLSNSATCDVPSGLFTTNVSTSSVTLNWASVSGASSYKVQYRKIGNTSWLSKTTSFTNKKLTSLSANTTYEYQVQTICSNGTSAYSIISSFYTGTTAVQARLADSSTVHPIENTAKQKAADSGLITNSESFTMFPNPGENGNIHVRLQLGHPAEVKIELVDMLGKRLYSGKIITDQQGYAESKLPLEIQLKVGIYQFIATTPTQKFQCKYIIK